MVIDRRILRLWGQILVACIPAAVIGLLFDDKIEALFYNPWTVAIMLVVVGLAFIVIESGMAKKGGTSHIISMEQMGWKEVIGIGLFQVIAAVFPGTSRSGATILGGLIMGMSRPAAASFTFYLAVPVMAGASLLKFLTRSGSFSGIQWLCVVVGMAVAYLVSILIIRFLMRYIRRNDFRIFAYYRILLGAVVLVAAVLKFI
jgi:undecaprenyl-diphosphatase